MGDHRRKDGRDGRRAGDRSRRPRLVRRRLGDDDGGDDAPVDLAEGGGSPGIAHHEVGVRRGLPRVLDRRRGARIRDRRGRALPRRRVPRLGRCGALRRRRRDRRRGPVPAHGGQGVLSRPVPHPAYAQPPRALGGTSVGDRVRWVLRRLLLGDDGGADRARRDEHRLDGRGGGADCDREAAAVEGDRHARCGGGPRGARARGRVRAGGCARPDDPRRRHAGDGLDAARRRYRLARARISRRLSRSR